MSNIQKNNKPNVPNLRFPVFSGEWKKSILKAECEINPKTGPLADTFQYIDLESVVKGQLIKVNYLKKEDAPSRAQRVLSKWDILYQCVRPYQLNNFLVRDNSSTQRVASTGYAQIRTNNNPDFFFQLLHTQKFTGRVINRCTGTNYPAINSTDLSEIEINIPEIKEQEKIGRMLSLIDQRIAIQNRLIEDLKKLKTALCELLYDESEHNCLIGDLVEQISIRNKQGESFKILSVSNQLGFVEQSEQFEGRTIASQDTSNYKIVSLNDFAYNPARINVGSIAKLKVIEKGIVSPMYVCFRCKDGVLPDYLETFFDTQYFFLEMEKRLEGSVRMCLSFEGLSDIPINLPSLMEQQAIAYRISTLSQKIEIEMKILKKFIQQKKYVLSNVLI